MSKQRCNHTIGVSSLVLFSEPEGNGHVDATAAEPPRRPKLLSASQSAPPLSSSSSSSSSSSASSALPHDHDGIDFKRTHSSVIFDHLKASPGQKIVTSDQVVVVMKRIFLGLLSPDKVEQMVDDFALNKGIISEMSRFDEREFKQLLNRLLGEVVTQADGNGDGKISRAEFLDNVKQALGWGGSLLLRPALQQTFQKALDLGDEDGDGCISTDEIKLLLQLIVTGEVAIDSLFPKIVIKALA